MGKQWDSLFEMLRDEVIAQGRALGLDICERCAEDSMPAAMGGDGDAAYNDHYEITGYKLDMIDDIDHGLPLAMKTVPASVGDASLLQEQFRSCMKQTGIRGLWIDGGYDSYENIGLLINGIKPHFHIHGNFVLNCRLR